jgi:hypothetical protein
LGFGNDKNGPNLESERQQAWIWFKPQLLAQKFSPCGSISGDGDSGALIIVPRGETTVIIAFGNSQDFFGGFWGLELAGR